MSKKRISKKELKEDAFVSAAFEASHYIQENKAKLILYAVSFLAVVTIGWLFVSYRIEQKEQAALSMFQAQARYTNGQYAMAATDFENIADDYSGTSQGRKALFFAGDAHFREGNYDRALEYFQRASDELPSDDPLLVNSLVGLAATHEQLGDPDQAIEAYRRAEQTAEYDFQTIEIMTSLARVLDDTGRSDEAIRVLEDILQRFPDSPRKGEIAERKAELEARVQKS